MTDSERVALYLCECLCDQVSVRLKITLCVSPDVREGHCVSLCSSECVCVSFRSLGVCEGDYV